MSMEDRRITTPNPGPENKRTYRVDMRRLERFEIKIQQGSAFLFGDLVDALGRYEDRAKK